MKSQRYDFQVTAGDVNIYYARLIADQQITFVLEFPECLDFDKLTNALAILHEVLPILSTVIKRNRSGFQRIQIPNYQPTLSILNETKKTDHEIVQFIGTSCDPECEPPLKVLLIQTTDKDILCFKIDHVLSDAAGLRYLLSLFAEAYTTGSIIQSINYDRGFGQIFHKFSLATLLRATRRASLPIPGLAVLHGEFGGETTFIECVSLNPDQFQQMKLEAKHIHTTINDMLLAALYQAVFKALNRDEPIHYPVMVPVDMRRYLLKEQRGVIGNLSSAVYPNLMIDPKESFHGTLNRVRASMDDFKQDQPGLGPMLLMAAGALFSGTMIRKRYQQASLRGSRFINYTNFGILETERFIFGNVSANKIYGVGPIQYAPGFLIALSTYHNVLHFVVQGKGSAQFQTAIRQFLNEIVCNLLNVERLSNKQK
jgi:NRPS condensation-like uncharacterized protein